MCEDHPNALLYPETADTFRSGDLDGVRRLISEQVVWHLPGNGEIRGRDELLAWLGQLKQRGFWLAELDVFGNDHHVCAISLMGARREATDASTRVVSVFKYEAGQQVERWLYADAPGAWNQIFKDRAASPTRASRRSTRWTCGPQSMRQRLASPKLQAIGMARRS